jgi:hypothetical protein
VQFVTIQPHLVYDFRYRHDPSIRRMNVFSLRRRKWEKKKKENQFYFFSLGLDRLQSSRLFIYDRNERKRRSIRRKTKFSFLIGPSIHSILFSLFERRKRFSFIGGAHYCL